MDTEIKRMIENKILIIIAMIVIGTLTIIPIFHIIEEQEHYNYLRNWKVKINGREVKNGKSLSLNKTIINDVKKHDIVSFSHEMGDYYLDKPVILFDTWNSSTRVYLDGEEIYSKGERYQREHKLFSLYRHCVSLPKDYMGKTLEIRCQAIINNPSTTFGPVCIFESNDPQIFWFERSIFTMFVGILFICCAIVLIVALIRIDLKTKVLLKQFALSLNFFILGNYLLSRARVLSAVFLNPSVYGSLEFIVLLIEPIVVMVYFRDLVELLKNKVIMFLYNGIFIVYSILIFVILALSDADKIYISEALPVVSIGSVIIAMLLFVVYIRLLNQGYYRVNKYKYDIDILGVFIIGYFITVAIFFLGGNQRIYSTFEIYKWGDLILPIYMSILFIAIVKEQLYHISKIFNAKDRIEMFKEMANKDVLTGIKNRLAFKTVTKAYEEEGINYGLISIDLNNLKVTNDTWGHKAGDILITSFAECVKQVEDKMEGRVEGLRIAGDEFAIVFEEPLDYGKIINLLYKFVDEKNSSVERYEEDSEVKYLGAEADYCYDKIKISFAHGMVERKDCKSYEEFLNLADKRMYECKRKMKAARKN